MILNISDAMNYIEKLYKFFRVVKCLILRKNIFGFPVFGHPGDELIGILPVIGHAAIMVQSIGYNKITCAEFHIVSYDLVEHLLSDGDMGRFVFHNHHGGAVWPEHHGVAALLRIVESKTDFVGNDSRRIPQRAGEPVHEMLAHILLGGKHHVFLAQWVEDAHLVAVAPQFGLQRRQIQYGKSIFQYQSAGSKMSFNIIARRIPAASRRCSI